MNTMTLFGRQTLAPGPTGKTLQYTNASFEAIPRTRSPRRPRLLSCHLVICAPEGSVVMVLIIKMQ